MFSGEIELSDGTIMPQIGYGLGGVKPEVATGLVASAIEAGYRLIDTATIYENEAEVGDALTRCDVPRDELFITTKVWPNMYGRDQVLTSFEESLQRLRLEEVDLYLLHWPAPALDLYVESWQALIELHQQGRARAIGVSNFHPDQLLRLGDETGMMPILNQIELHPYYQRREEVRFHEENGITTECWSPLGRSKSLEDPVIMGIAEKHEVSPAQIVLRWQLDCGRIVIPRSRSEVRMVENLDVDDIELSHEDHDLMAGLDQGAAGTLGPAPAIAS